MDVTPPVRPTDGRVLILAPIGRDAPLAARVLGQSGMATHICTDMADLCAEIERGAATALLAEEALSSSATQQLLDTLRRQPPWSDLPLVVLTARRRAPNRLRVLRHFEQFRGVTFLERPTRVMTLVSFVRAAVEARRRQYQVRDLLAELEQQVRQREDLLAMLGHELRNPLAPLRTSLEVLDRQSDNPAIWTWAREMFARQITHLSRIVDDVLEVSRITRGKVDLRRERLDLAELLRCIMTDHAPAFACKDVSLHYTPPSMPIWIHGDATRLTQVIGNLLHNACKFTDRGGSVTVRIEPDAAAGRVWVAIQDTGIGLDPHVLAHVFEPFVQARQNLDRSRGGLGLGLAMVHGLVRMHGGEVRAASDGPGTGSEFRFCLPWQDQTCRGLESNGSDADSAAFAAADRPDPLRVLIVEDHIDAAESLRMWLELDGHEVYVAATGPAGIEAAGRFRPDVVFCDLGLPGMDGYAVVAALRRHPATATVPIIALSGYAQDADRERCRVAGFTAHLAKPVDPDDLREFLATTAKSTGNQPPTAQGDVLTT
jgi:signal transduction histidine kinase/ActR/RegA family two-component response regulator